MFNIKSIIVIPVVFLCLLLTGCSSPDEKKERHYLKALEYIKQEQPKAAILELRNAIQIDEKYADARYQLGLLYLEENDARNAFQELVRAANLDHNNLDANLKAAELYLITRKNDESRKLVERILEKAPNHQDGLALLANLELIEGNFDEALEALDKIGDKVNTSDRFLNIKGRIHAARDEFDEAEAAFKKALSLESDKFVNYRTLLMFYQSRKDLDKIEKLLHEIDQKFPENPQTHLLLAGFYRNKGQLEQVEAELKKVIETAPENPRYRLMLSDYYTERRDATKAIDVLTKATTDIEDSADIDVALATIYFEQKNFESSRNLLDQILINNPNHGKAKLLQARFLLNDNKIREGIDILENLNNDFPNWADPFYYLAVARFSLGEIDLAQYAISTAIKKHPNDTKYHALLAQLYLLQSATKEAQKEAAVALKLNPSNLRAAIIMTTTLISEEEYDKAITALKEMNERVPGNLQILGNLAIATLRSGDKENGEKILEEILQLSPGNNRAILLLIELRYQDNPADAEQFIRSQIEKSPENSGLHVLFGDILLRQEKNEEALLSYEKAVELNPDNIQAYISAGKLLTSLDKKDEAMAKYQSMIAQNPQWIQGYIGIAVLLDAEGNQQEAIEYYKKALEIQPDFGPAANNLAWLISSDPNGDLGEALRYAMIAHKELPDAPQIADTLGWVHYKRGSNTLAIPQFELALSKIPGDPTITYHLALALNADGQKVKARETLEDLLNREVVFAERQKAEALLIELKDQKN